MLSFSPDNDLSDWAGCEQAEGYSVAVVAKREYGYGTGLLTNIRYPDAIFVVTPSACVRFDANTKPGISKKRKLAVLEKGFWSYKINKRLKYLVQLSPVTVVSSDGKTSTGKFDACIVPGPLKAANGDGCQIIAPKQWDSFFSLVLCELRRYNQSEIPYVLVN
jgi:hypothetical protein